MEDCLGGPTSSFEPSVKSMFRNCSSNRSLNVLALIEAQRTCWTMAEPQWRRLDSRPDHMSSPLNDHQAGQDPAFFPADRQHPTFQPASSQLCKIDSNMPDFLTKLRGRTRLRSVASCSAGSGPSKLGPIPDPTPGSVAANTTMARQNPAPTVTLETLPPEIRRQILFMTADLEDLRALVLASPIFYQQYLLDRKPLLSAALITELESPILLADAYAVQTSSSLYPPGVLKPDPVLTRRFLGGYSAQRATTSSALLQQASETDLAAMVNFYRCLVRPLVTECAARFLSNHNASPELGVVSKTERLRLSRALYRFQLYCNLFGPGLPGGRLRVGVYEVEVQIRFFGLFESWEVEEIDCLNHLFLHDRTDDGTVMGKILRRNTRHKGKRVATGRMQQYMDQATTADIKEVLDWRIQADRRSFHTLPADQAEERREVSRFSGDGEGGPPLAWAIMWQGRYSNRYGSLIPDSLKQWGYVFWDGERILWTPVKHGLLQTWKAHLPVFRAFVGAGG